jgi:hypothetical protein
MRTGRWWSFGLTFALVGCGGVVERSGAASGGSGPSASSHSLAGSGGNAVGSEAAPSDGVSGSGSTSPAPGCGPYQPESEAFPLAFELHSNHELWVRWHCRADYRLAYSCNGNPAALNPDTPSCTPSCSATQDTCTDCSCELRTVLIDPYDTQEAAWDGRVFDVATLPNGCACADGHPAPKGRYQFSIVVFSTQENAAQNTNGVLVTLPFGVERPPGPESPPPHTDVDLSDAGI